MSDQHFHLLFWSTVSMTHNCYHTTQLHSENQQLLNDCQFPTHGGMLTQNQWLEWELELLQLNIPLMVVFWGKAQVPTLRISSPYVYKTPLIQHLNI